MVIWDIAQQLQMRQMRKGQMIGEREGQIRDKRHETRADELESQIQQVLLVTEALWTLCRDHLDLTDDDLRAAMQAVLDAKRARAEAAPTRCSSCGAAVPHDMVRCQYCGTDTGAAPELFG